MKGRILAVEGIDGSGKTTQVRLLSRWLERLGILHRVLSLYANPCLSAQFRELNGHGLLTAKEAALMTAAEVAGRTHYLVGPLLDSGALVIWDKYVTGSRARDRSRGVAAPVLKALYDPLPGADFTLYFSLSAKRAAERKRADGGPGIWESGLDTQLELPIVEIERQLDQDILDHDLVDRHFAAFQSRVAVGYDALLPSLDHVRLEATDTVERLAARVRDIVSERFGEQIPAFRAARLTGSRQ
jgi:dTMP kinase